MQLGVIRLWGRRWSDLDDSPLNGSQEVVDHALDREGQGDQEAQGDQRGYEERGAIAALPRLRGPRLCTGPRGA